MSANALLVWISARRRGSWQQFRSAVEELHVAGDGSPSRPSIEDRGTLSLPLYQELRLNLQRLGHAEFFSRAGELEWEVTPPTLAVAPFGGGYRATLVGARLPQIVERLSLAIQPFSIAAAKFTDCPDHITITTRDHRVFEAAAKEAGLFFQFDAPAAILSSVPPIDDPCTRYEVDFPLGGDWRVEVFSPEELRWQLSTSNEARKSRGALYRFSYRYQRQVLFCSGGTALSIPSQVGKFLALRRARRRQSVVRFDSTILRLSVPAICRPPFLIERALILSSGQLPLYEGSSRGGLLHYSEIPETIASLTGALLCQEFR